MVYWFLNKNDVLGQLISAKTIESIVQHTHKDYFLVQTKEDEECDLFVRDQSRNWIKWDSSNVWN